MRESLGNSAGFTLLEALVAVTIVGLVAVSSLAAIGAQLRIADRARIALEAEALAQDQLTAVRLLPANDLNPIPDSLRHGTFDPPFDRYSWEHTVREVSGQPGLFDIAAVVTWGDGSYALRSRIYRPSALPRNP